MVNIENYRAEIETLERLTAEMCANDLEPGTDATEDLNAIRERLNFIFEAAQL